MQFQPDMRMVSNCHANKVHVVCNMNSLRRDIITMQNSYQNTEI